MATRLYIAFLFMLTFHRELPGHPGLESLPKENVPSIFDSFYDEDLLTITLTTDLDALINNRNREEPQDAVLTCEDRNGDNRTWNIELKPRGKYRRRICDFPPIKLIFSKEELTAAGLNHHNDLKLVTHCLEEKSKGDDNIMREYLAYKLYNVLTPNSFRVQMAKIQYLDSQGKIRPIRRYGFILEDTDEMATRLGGEECDECINPAAKEVSAGEENLMSVFQYMIGNSDWSLKMARNLKFVRQPSGLLLPVPFDFDFAGMVDAGYAIPNQDYGQGSIQNRIFLGFPPQDEILFQTLNLFMVKKEALMAEIKKLRGLDHTSRLFVQSFLDQFFFMIENGTEEQLRAVFTPAEMKIPLTPDHGKTSSSGVERP